MSKYYDYDPLSVAQGFARRDEEFAGWPLPDMAKPKICGGQVTTPIERVAKAIYDASPHNKPYRILSVSQLEKLRREAHAAIEAMREPSDAMVDAGQVFAADDGYMGPEVTWPLMIDAALAEGER